MGAEASVLSKERWEELRRLRGVGASVSQLARMSGLDRKTVRAALGKEAWTPYRRSPVGETLLTPHRAWLVERAPQVHYSARILFQELRAERGYRADTIPSEMRCGHCAPKRWWRR
jgi:transposase